MSGQDEASARQAARIAALRRALMDAEAEGLKASPKREFLSLPRALGALRTQLENENAQLTASEIIAMLDEVEPRQDLEGSHWFAVERFLHALSALAASFDEQKMELAAAKLRLLLNDARRDHGLFEVSIDPRTGRADGYGDPEDLPPALDAANRAFQYAKKHAQPGKFRQAARAFLDDKEFREFAPTMKENIATIANKEPQPGRKPQSGGGPQAVRKRNPPRN